MTNKKELRANGYLLLTALIWGFAFTSQRMAAEHFPVFAFNGLRFLLGAIVLLPVMLVAGKRSSSFPRSRGQWRFAVGAGVLMGLVLFAASALQQVGLQTTTAGKAAFITGLYVVLVPIAGIFLKKPNHPTLWVGVILAAIGLYFICVTKDFTITTGDLYEIGGAFLWAAHILVADYFLRKTDALVLSVVQVTTCGLLSSMTSLLFERVDWSSLTSAAIGPLLYSGILSVGLAYTLQLVGQRNAKPAHAAILLSMEAVFATLAGFLLLGENLGGRVYFGCALMILGMLAAQYPVLTGSGGKVRHGTLERAGNQAERMG